VIQIKESLCIKTDTQIEWKNKNTDLDRVAHLSVHVWMHVGVRVSVHVSVRVYVYGVHVHVRVV